MSISTLNGIMSGLWDKIRAFFDIIPKTIYFLYAALSSGVDAMQALVRKLAGLDVYYVGDSTVTRTDPLSEFIYGILGVGDNKVMYQTLNTVFWSLVVFAVIILAVSTIIAIIKSHYNEDTNGTSPWKYIYQAIKAIFTFALIPFVTLLGMKLATFTLNSLDQIITGSGTGDEVVAMYGSSAAAKFKYEEINGAKSYIYYDYFGSQSPTTSTTFSGMLFKAAAYSSNRVRRGSLKIENARAIENGGVKIFGASDCSNYTVLTDDDDRKEYIGLQVDYAFANCLKVENKFNYNYLIETTDDANVVGSADIFRLGNDLGEFSKFNVSMIWLFYNLWTFNYIIGFAGVFSVFAIMISIILGLMTRLLYGAALFLIYPTLLGLAPMDNFKAFKSWGSKFMGQILMAIGSIVGINLTLLIIPYVQTIKFFGIWQIDLVVNLIILVAGLMMAKDIIAMVSGFIGDGTSALTVGEGKKDAVKGALKQGAGMTAKVGLGTARVMGATVATGARVIAKGTARNRANDRLSRQNGLDTDAEEKRVFNEKKQKDKQYSIIEGMFDIKDKKTRANYEKIGEDAAKKFEEENKDKGLSDKEMLEGKTKARYDAIAKTDYFKDKDYVKAADEAEKDYETAAKKAVKNKDRTEKIAEKNDLTLNVDEDGDLTYTSKPLLKDVKDRFKSTGPGFSSMFHGIKEGFAKAIDGASIGRSIADAFNKTVGDIGKNTGIDKTVAASKDVLKGNFTWKGGAFDGKKDKATGDALIRQNAEKQEKQSDKTNKLLEDLLKETKKQNKDKSTPTTTPKS